MEAELAEGFDDLVAKAVGRVRALAKGCAEAWADSPGGRGEQPAPMSVEV